MTLTIKTTKDNPDWILDVLDKFLTDPELWSEDGEWLGKEVEWTATYDPTQRGSNRASRMNLIAITAVNDENGVPELRAQLI